MLQEISEQSASDEIAAIYADIREVQGLPIVNLIWRHLACTPGALALAWQHARPLYASGQAERHAAWLYGQLTLPPLVEAPASVFTLLGLSETDRRDIAAVLDTYNRGNGLNLMALTCVHARLTGDRQPAAEARSDDAKGREHPDARPHDQGAPITLPTVAAAVPAIPALDALGAPARELIQTLNVFGLSGQTSPVVASLYRHLALWPPYLAWTHATLAPLQADGRLDALVARTRELALARGRLMAASAAPDTAAPDTPAPDSNAPGAPARLRQVVSEAIGTFINTAICRMVPIGRVLRVQLGRD
ncbi:MAG: hypothetical protein KDK91_22525 [Gammaproteobacteria bacterium]|nr:hypothetical protein [Gammaproteobacteria bacterium]